MKFVFGNWKMNMSRSEIEHFEAEVAAAPYVPKVLAGIAVPSVYYGYCLGIKRKLSVGLQDVSEFEPGAHTGEISAQMAHDVLADFCLVGHSERRQFQHETNTIISHKIIRLQAAGVLPVLCVGETLEEFEAGRTREVLLSQLNECLAGFDTQKGLIIAYEPVWAIGTGKAADLAKIEEICGYVATIANEITTREIPVLYGGSVNAANAPAIARLSTVDGVLVGGASLDAREFLEIKKAFC